MPPPHYGGTERVTSLLTEELVRRRHEVDRRTCREHVERLFALAVMADGYERAYQAVVGAGPSPASSAGIERG